MVKETKIENWDCVTYKYNTPICNSLYVTIDIDKTTKKPVHCFIQLLGKRSACSSAFNEIASLIGLLLENDIELEKIIKTLNKPICSACINDPEIKYKSCCAMIAEVLTKYTKKSLEEKPIKKEVKKLKSPF